MRLLIKDSPTKDVMHQATAPRLYDVPTNGNIHISVEPNAPESPGHILDKHGDEFVPPQPGLMVRLDKAGSERVEVSKLTMWAIGVVPVVLVMVFQYGAAALGWARDDQTQKVQLQQMQNDQKETRDDIKALKAQFDDIQKTLQLQAIADAKKAGYELGAVDNGVGHAGKK